eukprot:2988875-Pyramimonas_sp.AAC.1
MPIELVPPGSTRRRFLVEHVSNFHVDKHLCGISKKQMRVIHAMWNHGAIFNRSVQLWDPSGDASMPLQLLSQSASFIRRGCMGSPSWDK